MDATLLIADNDVHRRRHLRRFFSESGFLVTAATDGLECLEALVALEPDVLVVEVSIPWGGGDGVIARLHDGLPIGKMPLKGQGFAVSCPLFLEEGSGLTVQGGSAWEYPLKHIASRRKAGPA